jgi:hypothetical protein
MNNNKKLMKLLNSLLIKYYKKMKLKQQQHINCLKQIRKDLQDYKLSGFTEELKKLKS